MVNDLTTAPARPTFPPLGELPGQSIANGQGDRGRPHDGPGLTPTSRSDRSKVRIGVGLTVVVMAMVTTACTSNPSGSQAPPSTIAAGSPWAGTFTPVNLPAPVNSLSALDCSTAKACWAVGSTVGNAAAPNGAAVIASVDGGAKWTSQSVPGTVGFLSGISCSDRHHCTAVGQTSAGQAAIISTSNGGGTWTLQTAPAGILDVTTVSCRSDDACLAIGSTTGGLVSLDSASPASGWVQQAALPATISGATHLSCSDATDCWVTGFSSVDVDHASGAVVLTTDGGATWSTVVTPTGIGYLSGVSCLPGSAQAEGALPTTPTTTTPTTVAPSTTATTAPSASGSSTTAPAPTTTTTAPAPTTTAVTSTPPSTTPVVGVAGVRCTVVGTTATTLSGSRTGRGLVLTTANGGATWTSQTITSSAASLRDVSCPAIGSCVTVGSAVATSDQAGLVILTGSADHPWKHPANLNAPQPMLAVSCVSLSHCVVVGESISEYLNGS
jgi:hypothetical protein